ncbi:MAG TPA: ABC transporter permease [Glaciihabitans sp.]|jgi:osmoprotectant transport system permease protein|nr:ABC transporter permease [Glaciihabitans sp.]
MNFFAEAMAYILDPANWGGVNGLDTRIIEHVFISLIVLAIAVAIAVPVGYLIGHTGKGSGFVVALSGAVRALPTLGLLILLALNLSVGLTAPVIALVVLAVPSILAGAYAGFHAIDRRTIDAARAVGMTEWQIVTKVEMPLGLPLLMGGIRSAALQVVATATLADYVGGGGLGRPILEGLQIGNYAQMLAGSVLVVLLAIVFELIFSALQKLVTPAGVTPPRLTSTRALRNRSRTA